ncbi:MAG: DUF4440 domain-containing protein, partial [Flammeovirgaceae bacterium]|nr:DUF4440 domain-containing protein [Flammeovirgaceae bacterium]
MKNMILFLIGWLSVNFFTNAQNQHKALAEIQKTMKQQEQAWNDGSLEKFMRGYYRHESLKFIGKSGVTYGWEATLANYKKNYPDKKSMGKLAMEIISMEKIDKKTAFVVGKWMLSGENGEQSGYFS